MPFLNFLLQLVLQFGNQSLPSVVHFILFVEQLTAFAGAELFQFPLAFLPMELFV